VRKLLLLAIVLSLLVLAGCSYSIKDLNLQGPKSCQMDCEDVTIKFGFNGTVPSADGFSANGCSVFCEPRGETSEILDP